MADYILTCCSTADVTEDFLRERNIPWIPFHFTLNGNEYPDDLGKSIPFPEFYQALRDGAQVNSSQINITEYLNFFETFLAEGKDILHISFSGGLSGSVNSARNAARIAKERYPDRRILVVDSLCASSGYGLFMDLLTSHRDSGATIDELFTWAETHRLRINHLFFSTDLTFYVKGGRLSRAAGLFGGVLNICPLLDMNEEGRLIPREKIRGKKAVIKRIVKKMEGLARHGKEYDGKVFICHSDCIEDAEEVKALVEAEFPNIQGPVRIFDVGTTIGAHTGPGTVAMFFYGQERGES